MGAAIAHRGPDDASRFIENDVALAFRRLSIIDVAGGQQPIWNEQNTCAILLNGEIYNHHGLRTQLEQKGHRFRTHSDVETVLHLWEDSGPGCLDQLRGMFGIAIWDAPRRTLFLARDRLGKKPLYYSETGGGLVFGSEIKAILQHPAVTRQPDVHAIELFLSFHYVPSPLTAFVGIKRLPPAHWLTWRDGRVEVKRYWDVEQTGAYVGSDAELNDEIRRHLREAVRIRLESEVPLGAFLSGGIDSSTVVALASESLSTPLNTFSIGFGPAAFDESRYARLVADRFGTNHHEFRLDHAPALTISRLVRQYDQPFGDSSAIPSLQVAEMTRRHVTVVLTGDGGDETFVGYDRYRLAWFAPWFRLPGPVRDGAYSVGAPLSRWFGRGERILRSRPDGIGDAYLAALFQPAVGLGLRDGGRTPEDRFSDATRHLMRYFRHDEAPLNSMLDVDVHSYLPDDLLVKLDMATMAHSLEARSPLLDQELVEFMATVPTSRKLGRRHGKQLLRRAMKGILPDEILNRSKKGFGVPLVQWLQTDLSDLMHDALLTEHSQAHRFFNAKELDAIVRATNAGEGVYKYLVWDLMMLELWHREYIDSVRVPDS